MVRLPQPVADAPDGLILFDGVCNLCSWWVRFVIRRDTASWFRFAPIQSPYGRVLASQLRIDPEAPDTNAVIIRGRAFFASDAALQILQRLPGWSWSRILVIVPHLLSDTLYGWVAGNRYRLFGRTATCMVPKSDVIGRFVSDRTALPAVIRRSPFQRLMGAEMDALPEPVRCIHSLSASLQTSGLATVTVAPGIATKLLCMIAGLPRSGRDIVVSVSFHPDGDGSEYWSRRFAERRYASSMHVGEGNALGLLVEHFGPFQLTLGANSLEWSLVGWKVIGVRLPQWSVRRIECHESSDGDRFTFDINVVFPLIGQTIHYEGWLAAG